MYNKNRNKKFINTKFSLIVYLLFLLYFFSNNLIYANEVTKNDNNFLIPIGSVLHIETQLENLIIRNSIVNSPFSLGDEIVSINNTNIKNYSDFSNIVNNLSTNKNLINLTDKRNNHSINIKTTK